MRGPYGAAPLPPAKVGAKCLAAVALAHHDRVLSLHLMCVFQISCPSSCFVIAMTELGQLIPLHITSADNMTDFETVLVCLLITLTFQISRFAFCFVSALTVSGQLMPLHIASTDNLANQNMR